MSLREKWINFVYRTATGSRRVRAFLAPFVGMFFIVFIALFVLASYWFDRLLKLPKIFPRPIGMALSIPLLTAGLFLVLWCDLRFFKAKGTPVPLSPPQSLVTTGPYAFSRNPMLTGLFLTLFGIGFLMRSLSLLFLFAPLFIFINFIELKTIEEPELEKRLGQPYVEYKKKVPMFIPRLGKKSRP